ncbi:MAG: hypothetical protein AAGF97_12190 [Planctomycetota bacterium]
MRTRFSRQLVSATLFVCAFPASACFAQHLDVLAQVVDGKLVTGAANYDTNTWLVGQNVFKRQLLSNFRGNDPGFTTLATGNPLLEPGVSGLASNTDLFFDILPSTIVVERANFWYWDGVDVDQDGFTIDDVDFGFAPPNVTWDVFDDDFDKHTADGSDTIVPDVLVQESFSNGAVHSHLILQVDDNDGNAGTTPPEGIYMTSMVLHADGYEESEPFFFVHRTSGLTNDPRDVAADWVTLNYDKLIRLPGDYDADDLYTTNDIDLLVGAVASGDDDPFFDLDGDGVTDNADLTLWREVAGAANNASGGPFLVGDANLDGVVDGQDFIAWNNNKFTDTALWSGGDFTADGIVDGQDFIAWNNSKFLASDAGVTAVPEPGMAGWFVAALVLGARRRVAVWFTRS